MNEDIRLETPKQLAARVGLSERQVRNLITAGELEHVYIGSRVHIPIGAFGRFVESKKQRIEWRDETKAPSCDGSQNEVPTTLHGPNAAARASAALARRNAKKLKSRSVNGSNSEAGEGAQVIRLKSS